MSTRYALISQYDARRLGLCDGSDALTGAAIPTIAAEAAAFAVVTEPDGVDAFDRLLPAAVDRRGYRHAVAVVVGLACPTCGGCGYVAPAGDGIDPCGPCKGGGKISPAACSADSWVAAAGPSASTAEKSTRRP